MLRNPKLGRAVKNPRQSFPLWFVFFLKSGDDRNDKKDSLTMWIFFDLSHYECESTAARKDFIPSNSNTQYLPVILPQFVTCSLLEGEAHGSRADLQRLLFLLLQLLRRERMRRPGVRAVRLHSVVPAGMRAVLPEANPADHQLRAEPVQHDEELRAEVVQCAAVHRRQHPVRHESLNVVLHKATIRTTLRRPKIFLTCDYQHYWD